MKQKHNSRKNILTKLIVISFLLYQAYPFKPTVYRSINIHQSLSTGRKLKKSFTQTDAKSLHTSDAQHIDTGTSGSPKNVCENRGRTRTRTHAHTQYTYTHTRPMTTTIQSSHFSTLFRGNRIYVKRHTRPSETRIEFRKAHQNKLYTAITTIFVPPPPIAQSVVPLGAEERKKNKNKTTTTKKPKQSLIHRNRAAFVAVQTAHTTCRDYADREFRTTSKRFSRIDCPPDNFATITRTEPPANQYGVITAGKSVVSSSRLDAFISDDCNDGESANNAEVSATNVTH